MAAGIFTISSAVSAVILANYGMTNIDFSKKELQGAAYIQCIWQSLQSGNTDPLADHESYDAAFSSAGPSADFAKAKGWDNRVSTAAAFIGAVADGSNLTLDPDLDSFYAMDAATVRLPNTLNMSLALSQAMALPPSDPDRRIKVAMALDRFETAANAAYGSLDSSIKDNAAGLTKQALQSLRTTLQASTDAMAKAAHNDLDGKPSDYSAAAAAFPAAVNNMWVATDAELSRLLQVRISTLSQNLTFDIAIVAALIVLSVLLTSIITVGLSRRFKGLDEAMTKLRLGDKNVEIPYLDDRNETGRIAATLADMKTSIIEREAAEEHAQTHSMRMVVSSFGEGLSALAHHDLTRRLDHDLPAGYRQLQLDFNGAMDQLSEALAEIDHRSVDVATNANQISSASDEMAGRTERQAAALEETAAAMEQITATVGKSAEMARQARTSAEAAKGNAESGSDVVKKAIDAIGDIEKSSHEISQIIGVIDEIAFQTNLLALNAGIEAARAGDAGRGFAVVASEVRALAGRSAEAAKQIKTLIKGSEQQVEGGVKLVQESGKALDLIVRDIAKINGLMNEIAAAGKEQTTALTEVNMAVNQLDQTTQQNAAMAEESTAACKSLADFARQLANLAGRFKTRGQQDAPSAKVSMAA